MAGELVLLTTTPVGIYRKLEPADPEMAPGCAIIGTYLSRVDRLIGRVAVQAESAREPNNDILAEPVRLRYAAKMLPEGIEANLFAIVPPERLREPWEASEPLLQDDDVELLMYLGKVVRVRDDVGKDTEVNEMLIHLGRILAGDAAPLVERLLRDL
jgi:hypothetical protein